MSAKSKTQINNASGEFRQRVETPFSVGLGLGFLSGDSKYRSY